MKGLTCFAVLALAACATREQAPLAAKPNVSAARSEKKPREGGIASARAPAGGEAAALAPAAAHLKLSALELSNAKGEKLALAPDGTVTIPPDPSAIGRVFPDGRFVAADGTLQARLSPDGEIFTEGDERLPVSIDDAGAIRAEGGVVLRFGPGGRLEGGNPSAPETTIVGVTEETRRTAAFLLILAGFPRRR